MSKESAAADLEEVLKLIDREAVAKIACDLVDIPSPTGYEKNCADYIMNRYRAAGIKIIDQQFEDKRSNILLPLNASVPGVTGIASSQIPAENIGKAQNEGFEASLNYQKRMERWTFNIGGNFTYARSKVLNQDEAPNTLSYQKATGQPIGSQLLYQATGIYKTWDQINSTPHLDGTQPGDLIYKDVNHDGQITYADESRAGKSSIPWIVYGITAGASWNNLDLSILFAGTMEHLTRISVALATATSSAVVLRPYCAAIHSYPSA